MSGMSTLSHGMVDMERLESGVYVGVCKCGERFVSPTRADERDPDKRKDAVYKQLINHVTTNPEWQAALSVRPTRADPH